LAGGDEDRGEAKPPFKIIVFAFAILSSGGVVVVEYNLRFKNDVLMLQINSVTEIL
jgi:phosphoribosylamine-glycine ligase|tara:strand:- start:209 stop:376 length:168 start_codon:yes stop_codon:yes gene_type:complete